MFGSIQKSSSQQCNFCCGTVNKIECIAEDIIKLQINSLTVRFVEYFAHFVCLN